MKRLFSNISIAIVHFATYFECQKRDTKTKNSDNDKVGPAFNDRTPVNNFSIEISNGVNFVKNNGVKKTVIISNN